MHKPSSQNFKSKTKVSIIISADTEWRIIKNLFPDAEFETSPYGEFFYTDIEQQKMLFFHGGWGKVSAAASTQYVIDKYNPEILINLGTCGAWGDTKAGSVILAEKTIIYDIKEAMGDEMEAIDAYTTDINLDWLTSIPANTKKALLVSADRDILNDDIEELNKKYGAFVGDWESGAIAYVAKKNNKKLIVLKGVSDVIGEIEAIGIGKAEAMYAENTNAVMRKLVERLPLWLVAFEHKTSEE